MMNLKAEAVAAGPAVLLRVLLASGHHPLARQSLLAEALERWPLPLFGASSRSPMRSTFRGTGKLSDPHSLFDIQVKRLQEHKHQHLNVLKLVIVNNRSGVPPAPRQPPEPSSSAARRALRYRTAKLIIKLINCIARAINQDPLASQVLKVEFLPDFNVKNGYRIYPAADLSDQTSTAGRKRWAQAT
jgi:Carbohydrate phosphorylase